MRLPRTALIATGFILPTFVLSLIVAKQLATHAKTQQLVGLKPTTITYQVKGTSTAQATTPSTTTQIAQVTDDTTANRQPEPLTQTPAPNATNTATPSTPSTLTATQNNNPTPIIATSAELSDWSAPILYTGTTPKEPAGTMVEYKYCTYSYSNGLTKQQLYQTQYGSAGAFDNDPNTGGWSITAAPEIGCTIANAPPVQ